jgi:hypothetical protein
MKRARSRRYNVPPRRCHCARAAPERRTHDDVRHGTTTLFAALEVATGRVTDQCFPQHRHSEFLAFLKQVATAYPRRQLHMVLDNYGTHTHATVDGLIASDKFCWTRHGQLRLDWWRRPLRLRPLGGCSPSE